MRQAISPRSSFLFLLFVICIGLSTAPWLHAQQDQQDQVRTEEWGTERRPRVRGIPSGFGGLTPAEAQKAEELLAEGRRLEENNRLVPALGKYKRVYKRYPRSAAAPEAYYRSAQIFMKRNRPTRAFEAIDAIVRAYPNYGRFNELISEEYRIAYELIQGRRLLMFGLFPGFPNRERGIEYFERLIFNAPYSDYAPLALMNIANEHARQGRVEAAIDALDRLITNYPNSLVTSDGYLKLAQIHEKLVDGPLYDQGSTREAINNYEDFLILFPNSSDVETAEAGLARMRDMLAQSRLKIGDFYYNKRARYTAAKVFYNEAITIAPNSQSAQRARERIAQVEADEARWEARKAAEAKKPERRPFLGIFGRRSSPEAPGTVEPTQTPTPVPPSTGPADAQPVPDREREPVTGAPSR